MELKKIMVYDFGIRIIWVQVSRLPMPHPDKDRWKHTMITNSFIFQYASSTISCRYVQMEIYNAQQKKDNDYN